MKAVCEREKMLHAFQTAASVAPSRSPKPILQNVKLDVTADSAMRMLKETDKTVTEIAFACGFNDSNYFTSRFHREIGMTPLKYRRSGDTVPPSEATR